MRYNVPAQTVADGETIALPISQVNSNGDIIASGTDGLILETGQYLVSFSTDASLQGEGSVGASLALSDVPIPYGVMSTEIAGDNQERLATTVIINLAGPQTLTVLNDTGETVEYTNSVLTVVKLA